MFKTDYGQEEAIEVSGKDPRQYCIQTKEFIGKNGNVDKLRLCQIEWKTVNCMLTPVEIPGTEETVSAQLVLLALGFVGTEQTIFDEFKVQKTPQNNVAANEQNYATSVEGIFTAGDARRGQSLVVWAIAEGRNAAAAVNKYLLEK